jgi:hypothetical protein
MVGNGEYRAVLRDAASDDGGGDECWILQWGGRARL